MCRTHRRGRRRKRRPSARWRSRASPSPLRANVHLARDPEKAWPGLDPGWIPVFGQDHAPTKKSVVIIVTTRSPRRKQEESSRPCGFVECHCAVVPLARASRQNDMSDTAIVDELAAAVLIVACAREPAFLRLAALLPRLLAPRCIISLLTSTAALPRRSPLAAPRRAWFARGCGFLAACLFLA